MGLSPILVVSDYYNDWCNAELSQASNVVSYL